MVGARAHDRRLALLLALFLALALSLFAVTAQTAREKAGHFDVMSLSAVNTQGAPVRLRVEVADTPDKRALGLMFRRHLPQGHGMLLRWREPRRVAIWMKNTFIALDIIFIDAQGRVIAVHEGAKPHDRTLIPSRRPVIAVLELAAGEARRLKLLPGARISLP